MQSLSSSYRLLLLLFGLVSCVLASIMRLHLMCFCLAFNRPWVYQDSFALTPGFLTILSRHCTACQFTYNFIFLLLLSISGVSIFSYPACKIPCPNSIFSASRILNHKDGDFSILSNMYFHLGFSAFRLSSTTVWVPLMSSSYTSRWVLCVSLELLCMPQHVCLSIHEEEAPILEFFTFQLCVYG